MPCPLPSVARSVPRVSRPIGSVVVVNDFTGVAPSGAEITDRGWKWFGGPDNATKSNSKFESMAP